MFYMLLVEELSHVILLTDDRWLAHIRPVVAHVSQHPAHLCCAGRWYLHAPAQVPGHTNVVKELESWHPHRCTRHAGVVVAPIASERMLLLLVAPVAIATPSCSARVACCLLALVG